MVKKTDKKALKLKQDALQYHRNLPYGKLMIKATKPLETQQDLSLAYSPGVAYACEAIQDDPFEASTLTSRGNLVAVISNGTAVLGLGDIGPLASKPVMEGKAVLFKKFSNIDVFDIEIDEKDIDKFCDIVASLEPTFGGINLEDIAAPACFEIEERLRERMNIPVFHDDQHGTAIIVGAAIKNALEIAGKNIKDARIVASGAGAASLACLHFLVQMGATKNNIIVCDRDGVVHEGRNTDIDKYKAYFSQKDADIVDLNGAIKDADIFLGLSAGGVLDADMVKKMAANPIILALANPEPEVRPEIVHGARNDAIICTGRSDYPNQVNNVLCFPFLFRGALDVGATTINEAMKIAAAEAIAAMAKREVSDVTKKAYGNETLSFGPHYIIPKPFDPRLVVEVSMAVAQAAIDSGVATRPVDSIETYRQTLEQLMYRTSQAMRPIFNIARCASKRVVYCEGEEERVLKAIPTILEENLARPILIGRRHVIEKRIEKFNLSLTIGEDFELCDPENDKRFREYSELYHSIMQRRGVSYEFARTVVRTKNTVIGSLMLKRGEADSMLCGTIGSFRRHMNHVQDIIGVEKSGASLYGMSVVFLEHSPLFLLDTHINYDPNVEQIIEMVSMAIERVKLFGITPRVGLLSHSNFGSTNFASAVKMCDATARLQATHPDIEIEGEMHADSAFSTTLRNSLIQNQQLSDTPNIFVFPNLDAANISYNLVKTLSSGGIAVGPILLGAANSANILTTSVTTRGVVNMTAYAALEATVYSA